MLPLAHSANQVHIPATDGKAGCCNIIGIRVPITPSTEPPIATILPPTAGHDRPQPIARARSRWPAIIGAVVTIAMLVGLARELFGSGLAGLWRGRCRAIRASIWRFAAAVFRRRRCSIS